MCGDVTAGETQPGEHDTLRGGYVINFTHPHPVRVVSQGRAQDSWGDSASRLGEMVQAVEESSHKRLDVDMDYVFTDGAGI
jgi:hypothetical protein